MKTNLTKRDKGLIASLILFAIISGVAGHFMGWEIEIDSTDFWQALLPALASIYFIYRTNRIWGGEVQRFLKVIGIGLVMHALLWGLIVQWHISGMPSAFSFSPAAIYVILHGLSAVAFAMTAYGFYLFYQSSKNR
ncbi:MAG: hypothetical protein ABEK04_06085, partial [Candidatus Nanohalobium sp.]